jgi:hypothetical protein
MWIKSCFYRIFLGIAAVVMKTAFAGAQGESVPVGMDSLKQCNSWATYYPGTVTYMRSTNDRSGGK